MHSSQLNPAAAVFKPNSVIIEEIMKSSSGNFNPIEHPLHYAYNPLIAENDLETIKIRAQKAEKISHLYAQTYNPYLRSDLQDLRKNTLPWSFNSAFKLYTVKSS
jgi:hypothetical protein